MDAGWPWRGGFSRNIYFEKFDIATIQMYGYSMARAIQQNLLGFSRLNLKEFGGSLLKSNPKFSRPISLKRPLHLVLRSTLAKGRFSFLHPSRARRVELLVHSLGRKLGVRVYRFANSGNHLHLVVLPNSFRAYRSYIRALSGLLARITMGVERGRALGKKFWDARPFTRILEWGQEFKKVSSYLLQNTLEALGFIPYQERKKRVRLLPTGNRFERFRI